MELHFGLEDLDFVPGYRQDGEEARSFWDYEGVVSASEPFVVGFESVLPSVDNVGRHDLIRHHNGTDFE